MVQKTNKFKPVDPKQDFVVMEKKLLKYWYEKGIVGKYLKKNAKNKQRFSFLDGPITANGPMGVHHAWGRTYKDLWQRFFNMKGYAQRFQNGFDEQGLWVEVAVERELGLKTKKDIENLVPGNVSESISKFVNLCKARVKKYSDVQTEQSKRLGYFMDWEHSYHTSSDHNNYAIWHYLKTIHDKGWLYKGRDTVPWCPRCGTAISQHEILTEEYQEITHKAVYVRYPIIGKKNTYLLVWTTTPWTLPGNVSTAVNPELKYVEIDWVVGAPIGVPMGNYIVSDHLSERIFKDLDKEEVIRTFSGKELIGLEYATPFDDLERVKNAKKEGNFHKVIASDRKSTRLN